MEALLIVDGRPNDTLAQVLETLGVADEIGPGWPRADLDVSQGVAIRCDDWDGLAELIERRPKASVMAFYTGPVEDLDCVDGESVSHLGRRYILRKGPVTPATEPYAHRIITMERLGVGSEGGSLDRESSVATGNLIFCPVIAHVDLKQLTSVGFSEAQVNAVALPPVTASSDAAYFTKDLIELRKGLRAHLDTEHKLPWEPTAVTLWALADNSLLRPFLLDGGHLNLTDREGGVTCVELEMCCDGDISSYRADFFGSERVPTARLTGIREALCSDVLCCAPHFSLRRTKQAHFWRDYELREYRQGERSSGSWQLVRLLLAHLRPWMTDELQTRLENRILDASAARGNSNPDHGLAEEALSRDAARIPWAPHAPIWSVPSNAAWNEAIAWIFFTHLAPESNTPLFGIPPWEDTATGWGIRGWPGRAIVIDFPPADAAQVFRWRLHAPVGATFLADNWSRLAWDDTMRLSETLRLH
jgi:hypothetical protein